MNPFQNESETVHLFVRQKEKSKQLKQETTSERIDKLKKLKAWIQEHTDDIKQALHKDLGKPSPESDITEISMALSEISHAVKNLGSWMKPQTVSNPLQFVGTISYVQYEPKGTSLIISPWNYPFNLAIGPLVSAISAGCTAVIKPSEHAPNTASLLERMISALFAPDEICVVTGDVEVAKALLALPFDHIFFTGSPAVGKEVMKAAAENLSSVTLELGGKSPVIVDTTCNLEDAAKKIAWSKLLNCGQTCIAPDYLLVHANVYDTFLPQLAASFQAMLNPKRKGIDQSKDYGRIVNDNHWKRLKGLLDEALDAGSRIAYGGNSDEERLFMEPTLLENVNPGTRMMQEEIFGPILPVVPYNLLEEAISTINSRPKPLALYAFSNSPYIQNQILENTSSGAVVINDCAIHFGHPNLPFGGINSSGIGKAHGHFGFLAFTNEKAILKQNKHFSAVKSLFPPYGFKKKQLISAFRKFS